MIPHLAVRLVRAGAILTASLGLSGVAQVHEVTAPSVAAPAGTNTHFSESAAPASAAQKPSEQKLPADPLPSAGLQEILKMADAGVSKEVIRAYVENSPTVYNPSAADMITLKEHGVPDDITLAMLKRRAEVRSPNPPASLAVTAPARPASTAYRLSLDPESYDYFQYYYLYPRTLAFTYDRLGFYPGPYFPGYYGSFGVFSPGYRHFGIRRGFSPVPR